MYLSIYFNLTINSSIEFGLQAKPSNLYRGIVFSPPPGIIINSSYYQRNSIYIFGGFISLFLLRSYALQCGDSRTVIFANILKVIVNNILKQYDC